MLVLEKWRQQVSVADSGIRSVTSDRTVSTHLWV
jgi:hypothetical protein